MYTKCRRCHGASPSLAQLLSGDAVHCAGCGGRGVVRRDSAASAAAAAATKSAPLASSDSLLAVNGFSAHRGVYGAAECVVLRNALLSRFATQWLGSPRVRALFDPTPTACADGENPLGLRAVGDVALVDAAFLRVAVDPRLVALAVAALGDDVNLHSTRARVATPALLPQADGWRHESMCVKLHCERNAAPSSSSPPPPPVAAADDAAAAVAVAPVPASANVRFTTCTACLGASPSLAALMAGSVVTCVHCDGRGVVRVGSEPAAAGPAAFSVGAGASAAASLPRAAPVPSTRSAFCTVILHLDGHCPHGGALEIAMGSHVVTGYETLSERRAKCAVAQPSLKAGDVLVLTPGVVYREGANGAEERSKVSLVFVYSSADAIEGESGNHATFATLPVARRGAACTTLTL